MKFSIKTDHPDKQRSDVLVLGVYDSLKVAYDKPILSTSTISYLASILKHGDMSGKAGSSLILYNVPGTKIPKILLIGLGKEKELDGKKYRAAVRSMIDALKKMDVKTIASYIQIAPVIGSDIAWNVEHFINEVMDATYEFAELKTINKKTKKTFDFLVNEIREIKKLLKEH